MRRVKQAAMLLTLATAMGWSGPSADARASRVEQISADQVEAQVMPTKLAVADDAALIADGEWRYVPARR